MFLQDFNPLTPCIIRPLQRREACGIRHKRNTAVLGYWHWGRGLGRTMLSD